MRRALAAAVVLLAMLHRPGGAYAQTPTEPGADEATRGSARELGEQGNALFAAGDHAGALEKYERAYALVPVPTLGVRIARSLVALGRLVEASERYLAVQRAGLPPNFLPVHERALDEARSEREALLPRIPAIVVTVSPTGADVWIDGASMPRALLGEKRVVDPGTRVVEVRLGEASKRVAIEVAEGAVVPVHVALDGMPGAVAPHGAPTGPPDEKPASSSPWPVVGWVTVGVGGAAAIVGVATGLVAMGQRSDLEASCGAELACPPAFHDDADSYNGLRTLSGVTFFAGLGLAAAGTAILLFDPGGSGGAEATRPGARFVAGPGRIGVVGAF